MRPHLISTYFVYIDFIYFFFYLSFILFAITAAGVVPCGGHKKAPRTPSIVQIIFSFWSFEISEGILRIQKIIIGLDAGMLDKSY